MERSERSYKGHAAMLAASVIWGLNAPFGKAVLEGGISPLALTTLRMGGAAVAFWLLSLFSRKEKVAARDRVRLFYAALLGVVVNQGAFIFGLSLTSPIDASIVTTTAPIVTMVVAALFLREPLTGMKAGGVLLGAAGALILILGEAGGAAQRTGNMAGDALCLAGQISFALYLTLFRGLVSRYSPVTVMKWMFAYALLCYLPFSLHALAAIDFSAAGTGVWSAALFVIFAATFLAYLLLMTAQRLLRPTLVSMYNYVQPVVAAAAAVWMGLGRFGWAQALAVGLVFTGVAVVTRSKSRAQIEAARSARRAGAEALTLDRDSSGNAPRAGRRCGP